MRPFWIGLLAGGIVLAVLLLFLIYLPEMLVGSGAGQQQAASSALLAVGPYMTRVHFSEIPLWWDGRLT